MFKRAWLSTVKNRARSLILVVLLFVIANLVLASISVKSATNEAMDLARQNLGAELTLSVDKTSIMEEMRKLMEETGERPNMEELNASLGSITSDIAYEIADSEYVIDYNFSLNQSAEAVDFVALESSSNFNIGPNSGSGETNDDDFTVPTTVTLVGTNNASLLSEFGEDGNVLTDDSTYFTGGDTNVAIISYDLSFENDLRIGDTVTVSLEENEITLSIVGLFQNDETISGVRGNTSNQIYVPINDIFTLTDTNPDEGYTLTSATYYLNDPLNVDAFISEQTTSVEDIADGLLKFNDTEYDSITEPIQQVGSFSNIILIVVVVASVLILTLLVVNTLKDRKYEIGVLMSLGEEKGKIILQYVVELILIATLAFTLSIATANQVSSYLGDTILEMQIEDLEETGETTFGAGRFGGGMTNINTDVNYVDEINVEVGINDFFITLGVGLGIVILSSIGPSVYITRFQPKKIFSSRN